MIKIFERNETDFSTNGLGQIVPLKCIETKRKNFEGWYIEVEVDLDHESLIAESRFVLFETKEKGEQIFCITNPEVKSTVKFTANHIVFSTSDYLLDDVRPTNLSCKSFLEYINGRVDTTSPFIFNSNISDSNTAYFIRQTLGEALVTTCDLFDGVFDFDNYNITLNTISTAYANWNLNYGSNIESIVKYENWDDVVTKILPVGSNELLLPEQYIYADIEYDKPYSKIVSFTTTTIDDNGTEISEEDQIIELRALAEAYVEEYKYPKLNYTVSSDVPQEIKVGEKVEVKHPIATFDTEVIAYTYNGLTKKVLTIEFGNYERNLTKEISNLKSSITSVEEKVNDNSNFLTKAKAEVYEIMNAGGDNGYIYFKCDNNGVIQEIYAMDSDSLNTATNIMRLNYNGLAGTTSGINGTYNSAILANGTIVADRIKTGIIGDSASKNSWNMVTGALVTDSMTATNANISGTLTSNNGTIGGWAIGSTGLTNGDFKILSSGASNVYTWGDLPLVKSIIMGEEEASEAMIAHFDLNGDGSIGATDYLMLKTILNEL